MALNVVWGAAAVVLICFAVAVAAAEEQVKIPAGMDVEKTVLSDSSTGYRIDDGNAIVVEVNCSEEQDARELLLASLANELHSKDFFLQEEADGANSDRSFGFARDQRAYDGTFLWVGWTHPRPGQWLTVVGERWYVMSIVDMNSPPNLF